MKTIKGKQYVREELPRSTPFGPRNFRWFEFTKDGAIDQRGQGFRSLREVKESMDLSQANKE
jgi:hypothetical protein